MGEQLVTVLKNLQFNGLTQAVELAQLLSQLGAPLGVLGEQQLQGGARLFHAPGGVDAGGQAIADGDGGGHLSPGTARLPQQGLEAGAGAVGQPFQA